MKYHNPFLAQIETTMNNIKTKTAIAWLLTGGAALTLGLLSFGGIYVFSPVLGLAISAFVLATVYEAEIYKQNILSAFKKFNYRYLKRHMATKALLEKALAQQINENTLIANDSAFLSDYIKQLKRVAAFEKHHLHKDDKKRKKEELKRLRHMEKWYADLLHNSKGRATDSYTDYEKSAINLLSENEKTALFNKTTRHLWYYRGALAFSVVAGVFWGLGTIYLLAGVLPLIAPLGPAGITVIMIAGAVLAGSAYIFLTYNAITDMINNETVKKIVNRVRNEFRQGNWKKLILYTVATTLVVGLTVTLTVFTAGTWWTVATNSGPILTWLKSNANIVYGVVKAIPSAIMFWVLPAVMGLAALFFNVENASESLESIIKFSKKFKKFFSKLFDKLSKRISLLAATENLAQRLNPIRFLIVLTVVPICSLLFICHLISIAVTADRFPGIPALVTAFVGFLSEFLEDLHYFLPHSHHTHNVKKLTKDRFEGEAGHSHDDDIPSLLVKIVIGITLKPFAVLWDYLASLANSGAPDKLAKKIEQASNTKNKLSFRQAVDKHYGTTYSSLSKRDSQKIELNEELELSTDWQNHHQDFKAQQYIRKHFGSTVIMNRGLAQQKKAIIRTVVNDIKTTGETARDLDVLSRDRYGIFNRSNSTATSRFIEDIRAAATPVS